MRREGCGNARHALGELLDEEPDRVFVARHLAADLLLHARIEGREVEQGARVHADHPVDDEFEPGEANAMVRDRGEIEGAVRVADVHHDAHGRLWQSVELDALLLEVEAALVDHAGIALRAGHGDRLSVPDLRCRVAASDHRRDAELTGDDRCMAGSPATVCHDRCGALHDGLPVGVSHVRNEHVARLHARHLACAGDDAGRTRADPQSDRAAARELARSLAQGIAQDRAAGWPG